MRVTPQILVLFLCCCSTHSQIFNTKEELLNFLRLKNQGKSQEEALAISIPHLPPTPSSRFSNRDEITTFRPSLPTQHLVPEDNRDEDSPRSTTEAPNKRLRIRPRPLGARDQEISPKKKPGRRRLNPVRSRVLSDQSSTTKAPVKRVQGSKTDQFRRRQFVRPERVKAIPVEEIPAIQEESDRPSEVDRSRFPTPNFAKSSEVSDDKPFNDGPFKDQTEGPIFNDFDDLPSENTPVRSKDISPPFVEDAIRLNRPSLRFSPHAIVKSDNELRIQPHSQRPDPIPVTTPFPSIDFRTLDVTTRHSLPNEVSTQSIQQVSSTTSKPPQVTPFNSLDDDRQFSHSGPTSGSHQDEITRTDNRGQLSFEQEDSRRPHFDGQTQRGSSFSVQRVPVRRIPSTFQDRSQLQDRRITPVFNENDFPEKQGIHQVITRPPHRPVSVSLNDQEEKSEPIKTIKRYSHENPDGSFTFGYESADGSFKEETRGVDCVVRGKYGYIDPDGVKREFTYVSGNPCDPDNPESNDDSEEQHHEERVPETHRPRPRPPPPALPQKHNHHAFQESEEDEDPRLAQSTFSLPQQSFKPRPSNPPPRENPKEHGFETPININRFSSGQFSSKPQLRIPTQPPSHTTGRPVTTTPRPRTVTPSREPHRAPATPRSKPVTPTTPKSNPFSNPLSFSVGQPLVPFQGSIGVQPGIPVRFGFPESSRRDDPKQKQKSEVFGRPEGPQFDRPGAPRFGRPEGPRFDRPEGPRFDRPEGPRFDRPEGPRFDRPEGPRFDRPEAPRFDRPEGPRFDRPEGPRFDRPEGPRFDRPEDPRFDRPEGPRFDRPEGPRFDRPEGPRFDRPESQRFDRPEAPRLDIPEAARLVKPQTSRPESAEAQRFERPEVIRLDRPEASRPERPESHKFERPESPRFERPQTARLERPETSRRERLEGQNFDRPESARFERPQTARLERPVAPAFQRPDSPGLEKQGGPKFERPSVVPNQPQKTPTIPPFQFSSVSRPTIERVPSILVSNINSDEDAKRNPFLVASGFDFDRQLANLHNQNLHLPNKDSRFQSEENEFKTSSPQRFPPRNNPSQSNNERESEHSTQRPQFSPKPSFNPTQSTPRPPQFSEAAPFSHPSHSQGTPNFDHQVSRPNQSPTIAPFPFQPSFASPHGAPSFLHPLKHAGPNQFPRPDDKRQEEEEETEPFRQQPPPPFRFNSFPNPHKDSSFQRETSNPSAFPQSFEQSESFRGNDFKESSIEGQRSPGEPIQNFEQGNFSPFVQRLFGNLHPQPITTPAPSPFEAFAQQLQLRL